MRRSSAVRDVLQTVVFVEKHDLHRCETAVVSIHERQDIRMLGQGCILLQYKDSNVRSPSHCAATPATLCHISISLDFDLQESAQTSLKIGNVI